MSGFNHLAVQAAIHAALVADEALGGMVSGVFDFVPPNTAYPYIVMGDARETDVSTMTETIRRVEMALHVYSRARGRGEASGIMARVHALLHDAALDMENAVCVDTRVTGGDIWQGRDGLTYHGQLRLVVTVQVNGGAA